MLIDKFRFLTRSLAVSMAMEMERRAAGFVIFRRIKEEVQYLLLQASYGDHHWTPPKGHVDPGEDDYTTALRETREEAGYTEDDLHIYKDLSMTLKYTVKGHPKTVIYWLAELRDPSKDPKLSDEHENFKWLPKNEAKTQSGYEDFKKMVDFFDEKIKNL